MVTLSRHSCWKKLHSFFFLQLLFCTQFFTLKKMNICRGSPLQVFGVTTYLYWYSHLFCPRKEPLRVSDWVHFLLVKCHLKVPHSVIFSVKSFVHFLVRMRKIILKNMQKYRAFLPCGTSCKLLNLQMSITIHCIFCLLQWRLEASN